MNNSSDKPHCDDKGRRHHFALAVGVFILLAYVATYLLTVSPVVVRAIGTALGG